MAKQKDRMIDVEVEDDDGKKKKIKIMVKKPNNAIMSAAQRKGALVWTQCIQEGIMTKKELEKILDDRNIWTKAKDKEQASIMDEISKLEKSLYLGPRGTKLKSSKGKDIAIQMRKKRLELRELLSEKVILEQNTAESLSDNARFDYIVAYCTFHGTGEPVYDDLDDYSSQSDDEIAFAAAQSLATMLYSLDKDFEEKLPENKFLKKFEYIDTDLHLINKVGHKIDLEGRLVNEEGHYVDEKGRRVDNEGNSLDEDGLYKPTLSYDIDDQPKPKKTNNKKVEELKPQEEVLDSTDSK